MQKNITSQGWRLRKFDYDPNIVFADIVEVQEQAVSWLWHCNNERPKMGLGGITPRQKLLDA